MADLPRGNLPSFSRKLSTLPDRETEDTIQEEGLEDGGENLPVQTVPPEIEILGKGGTATVHAARDQALGREIALKRLHPEKDESDGRRRAFIREARITGNLQHPNIVPIHALGADDAGQPFFTMQIVEGITLRKWLRARAHHPGTRERLEKSLEILLKVCDALSYAHSCGVLHRDLKPDNIMVGPHGRVYLVDWGIALGLEERSNTEASKVAGTPGYMAPEQARGEHLDERADIFGLGAILYEILTGRLPYSGERAELAEQAMKGAVLPIGELIGIEVSPRISAIVDKALSPQAADRYATVEEFQEDLRLFLQGGFHLPRRTFNEGDVILKEGDLGNSAYMIIEGSCQVLQKVAGEERKLRVMSSGDIFGELALLLDGPRTATVVAKEQTTLMVLDKQALKSSGALHGWSAALLKALAHRFLDLEQRGRK